MALFKRGTRDIPYLTASSDDLRRIGQTAFGGESVYPPGIGAIPVAELDGYVIAAIETSGASPGTPAWTEVNRRFLNELEAAAAAGGDWAYAGALCVGQNFVTTETRGDPTFLAVVDRALELLRVDGVSYTALPRWAVEYWQSQHGVEGIHPAGWPSALEDVATPHDEDDISLEELAIGESRKLAQAPAAPANMIYAERRYDGTVAAVIEGTGDDGQLRRWDWAGVTAPDYKSFLCELGERLVTHSYWAHDDLIPLFPCRLRARDGMRTEARAKAVPPMGSQLPPSLA
jgi:hypothetical protein